MLKNVSSLHAPLLPHTQLTNRHGSQSCHTGKIGRLYWQHSRAGCEPLAHRATAREVLAVATGQGAIRLGLLFYFAILEFRASSLHSLTHFLSISSLALFLWSTLELPCFCCNSVFFVSPSASLCLWSISCLIFSLSSSLLVYLCCLCLALRLSLPLPGSHTVSLSPSSFLLTSSLLLPSLWLIPMFLSLSLSLFWRCSSTQLSQSGTTLTAISNILLLRVEM